jgi:hypothetical protein
MAIIIEVGYALMIILAYLLIDRRMRYKNGELFLRYKLDQLSNELKDMIESMPENDIDKKLAIEMYEIVFGAYERADKINVYNVLIMTFRAQLLKEENININGTKETLDKTELFLSNPKLCYYYLSYIQIIEKAIHRIHMPSFRRVSIIILIFSPVMWLINAIVALFQFIKGLLSKPTVKWPVRNTIGNSFAPYFTALRTIWSEFSKERDSSLNKDYIYFSH